MTYIKRGNTVYTVTETAHETIIDVHDVDSNYIRTVTVSAEEYRK
jgi:hypothetical protein